MKSVHALLMAALVLIGPMGCGTATAPASVTARPTPTPVAAQPIARGPLVTAANPLAVEAGMAVLRRGGSAVDAAVAVQAVLGLVEPQSSGLGGGAFLMLYDAETGHVTAYDGRETAPASATHELFYQDGRPLPFMEAVLSGRSTGVPGVVAMLGVAQREHGKLAWSELFGDAERLADQGFIVSPRLAGFIAAGRGQAITADARAYFSQPDGSQTQAGDRLVNPAYARTVREIAQGGPEAFYRGRIAADIVRAVSAAPLPGGMTEADIASYRPIERGAICRPFRLNIICVPPPPSSGAAVLQLLAMAERTPALEQGPNSAAAWTAFAQLQRLMYADRAR